MFLLRQPTSNIMPLRCPAQNVGTWLTCREFVARMKYPSTCPRAPQARTSITLKPAGSLDVSRKLAGVANLRSIANHACHVLSGGLLANQLRSSYEHITMDASDMKLRKLLYGPHTGV